MVGDLRLSRLTAAFVAAAADWNGGDPPPAGLGTPTLLLPLPLPPLTAPPLLLGEALLPPSCGSVSSCSSSESEEILDV